MIHRTLLLLALSFIILSCSKDVEEGVLQTEYNTPFPYFFEDTMIVIGITWLNNTDYAPGSSIRPSLSTENCICYDSLIINNDQNTYYHSYHYDFNTILYDSIVVGQDSGSYRIWVGDYLEYNQDSTQCFFRDHIDFFSDIHERHSSDIIKSCREGAPIILEMPTVAGPMEYYISQ